MHAAYQIKDKDSSSTKTICLSKFEVKWLTSGWPSLTANDLFFGTYAWYISKESWAARDKICDNLSFLFLTMWPLMTMIWPKMTFLWTFDLKNDYNNYHIYQQAKSISWQFLLISSFIKYATCLTLKQL